MYSAILLANRLIYEFSRINKKITPMKLQKLIYIIYKEYLTEYDDVLFAESFEAWRYGPVVRSVYDEFKSFGSSEITKYAKSADGSVFMADLHSNEELQLIFLKVFNKFLDTSGVDLSKKTHDNIDSAWQRAIEQKENIIRKELIKDERTYL